MTLQDLLAQYCEYRKTLGLPCVTTEGILRSFCRKMGPDTEINNILTEQVQVFLKGTGALTATWHRKRAALLSLYRYAISRSYVSVNPLPPVISKQPPTFAPYIYSDQELRHLFATALSYQKRRQTLTPHLVHAVLVVLFGAGLRLGEALKLTLADVDLTQAVLTIRETKFFKSRFVPVGPKINEVLRQYASRRKRDGHSQDRSAIFFVRRNGEPVSLTLFERAFRNVRAQAGIGSLSGRGQPRLHDLRHTFATKRLTTWYQQHDDVQRLLPYLSVYLGHISLASTSVYLTMTTELLHQASVRFERYARKGGSYD